MRLFIKRTVIIIIIISNHTEQHFVRACVRKHTLHIYCICKERFITTVCVCVSSTFRGLRACSSRHQHTHTHHYTTPLLMQFYWRAKNSTARLSVWYGIGGTRALDAGTARIYYYADAWRSFSRSSVFATRVYARLCVCVRHKVYQFHYSCVRAPRACVQ